MTSADIHRARKTLWQITKAQSQKSLNNIHDTLKSSTVEKNSWHVSHPINKLTSIEALIDQFWTPFLQSFPDLERQNDIFLAGTFNNKTWVASSGHYLGTFSKDWLGIPKTDQLTYIRFGEFSECVDGRVADTYMLLDIVGVARQAGVNLIPKSKGVEMIAPAPLTHDGVRQTSSPDEVSAQSLSLVEAMADELLKFDQKSLASMNLAPYWHKDMHWYGPSGIGAMRGLNGFQKYHQEPFLKFVPDRVGGNHVARFADGDYVASAGWPSIRATTSGSDWIDTKLPAGMAVTMRVMDFWRREKNVLRENWVFIDIPHVFLQLGIDVFDCVKN